MHGARTCSGDGRAPNRVAGRPARNRSWWPAWLLAAIQLLGPGNAAPTEGTTTALGIAGNQFTLNGKPTFLLGFSYYGALGASRDSQRRDLEAFAHHGFNWLRVWATWAAYGSEVSAVDAEGRGREPFLTRLRELVAACDRQGLVVDITLTRGAAGEAGRLADFEAHLRAVETLITVLKPHRNWYLDLANERDVRDARFVPATELQRLRARVRELDADRLVTASFGGHDLTRNDLREALEESGVDFLAPHRPRYPGSPTETATETRRVLGLLESMGRTVPVHYQEPFRRGYTQWQPDRDDFLEDLRGAVRSGAAGWCFHNGSQKGAPEERPRRSFDLRETCLWDQLDAEERAFVNSAAEVVRTVSSD